VAHRESALARWLWLPVNALQALATALWMGVWVSVALGSTAVTRRPRTALALARRVWAPGQLAIGGARLVVRGAGRLDRSRACLFVANHQSWIDVPALFAALPFDLHFLAKKELARVPFLGAYIRSVGMVFVDRAAPREARSSVGRTAELLASGRSVVSFPEGTRSRDGELGEFKSGGFGAALESGADVVPVALVGPARVLPPGGFRPRPGTIEVRVGAPIPTAGLGPQARVELARRAHDAVERLLRAEEP
jgi:1-acyl-sn-glycerol-3-phosphate acyltransferase